MASNIIVAKFCADQTRAWTDELWQYDYGQVLKIEGLDLPDAYEVHFGSQPITGETITQIGNSDGVTIPDQFLQNGKSVYAWIYLHTGEDDGETEYMITMPVNKRPEPSNEVPTPVEQSAIDQAIAALNIAVEKSEEAIGHYPKIEDGTWWVWDVNDEIWVDTEVEARGPQGIQGIPGPRGPQGPQGPQGEYAEVDSALSDTSENPVQNKVIKEEVDGLIDDINHKQDAPSTLGTDGQIMGLAEINGQLVPVWINPLDVQINSSSIVNNGVANIPKAAEGVLGAVSINSYYGIQTNSNGRLYVQKAIAANVKSGDNEYQPIVPENQHKSVFYGLAKLAGADMASLSGETVGVYPDAQKVAIQKMLGIYEPPFELLNEITLDAVGGIDLTADSNGTPYNLLSVFIQISYPANAETITSGYSRFRAYDSSNSRYVNVETGRYTTATNKKYKLIYFEKKSNLTIGYYTLQASVGGAENWHTKDLADTGLAGGAGGAAIVVGNITRIMEVSGDTEPIGTRFRIYGQRAY